MKHGPTLLTVAACGLMGPQSFSQAWQACSAGELIQRIADCGKLYADMPAFSLHVDISSYRSATDPAPFDAVRSTITKAGANLRTEMGGIITVQDERLRITVDTSDRTMMIARPVDLIDVLGGEHQKLVLQHAASIQRMGTSGMVAYKVIFRPGAYYDRFEMTYDAEGWLRRIECYWRQPVPEDPDDPGSATYLPKMVMVYARPKPVDGRSAIGTADPNTMVSFGSDGPRAIGRWKGYSVFDARPQ